MGSPASLRKGRAIAQPLDGPLTQVGHCGVSFRVDAARAGCRLRRRGQRVGIGGGNRQNTRFQESEHTLSVANVGGLQVKWELETGSDVSPTPAVDADTVYARLGRQPVRGRPADRRDQVDGEHSACQRFVHGQGANHASGDGRQGDRRHPGRHLSGAALARRCSRSTSSPVRARLEHQRRPALRRDRHAVTDGVRRQGLRRRGVSGGGAGGVRARLRVVVPGQHARSTSRQARSSGRR